MAICPVGPYRARNPRATLLHHRELLGSLARAAWETVMELMCAAVDEEELRPGMGWGRGGAVRYWRKGGHEDPALRLDPVEAFDPSEFLARVIMHIPEPRRHLVRYYGAYSNVLRGMLRSST